MTYKELATQWAYALWQYIERLEADPPSGPQWQLDRPAYVAYVRALGLPHIPTIEYGTDGWKARIHLAHNIVEISAVLSPFWASVAIYHELQHAKQLMRYPSWRAFIRAYDDSYPKPVKLPRLGSWEWIRHNQAGHTFEREALCAQSQVFSRGLLTTPTL